MYVFGSEESLSWNAIREFLRYWTAETLAAYSWNFILASSYLERLHDNKIGERVNYLYYVCILSMIMALGSIYRISKAVRGGQKSVV